MNNKKSSLRLQLVAFSITRAVLNTTYRMVYPFLPAISRGLGVEITTLSLAFTGRSLTGAFGPLLAVTADHKGRKFGMLLGMVFFTAGVIVVVIWPTFPVFFLSLILTTLGKYLFDPPMQAYLGDRIAYNRRGLAVAITELGWSFSFIIGVPIAGFLISRYGWFSPYKLLSILAVLLFGFLAWMLPDDSAAISKKNGLWDKFLEVIQYKPAIAGLGLSFAMSLANEIINMVFGIWMEDSFGLKITALGAASLLIGIAELGGESLVGGFVDRIGKPRAVMIGIILNSASVLILPIIGTSVPGALIGLFLFYLTFEFTIVSVIPLMTEIMPSNRSTIMAFNITSMSIGRAAGALTATSLYALGITVSSYATVVFNVLALWALSKLADK